MWDESPLPIDNPENAFRVIVGDFVTTEDGTGIVHGTHLVQMIIRPQKVQP